MKKYIFATSALFLAFSVQASDYSTPTYYGAKQGHHLYVGYSSIGGDLSDTADNMPFSVGYDYTTHNGIIVGAYYMPELYNDVKPAYNLRYSVDSSVLGLYSGYQFDNNIRVTAGLNFTHSEVRVMAPNAYAVDSDLNGGFVIGADYQIQNIVVGGRFATHKMADTSASTFTANIGFKF